MAGSQQRPGRIRAQKMVERAEDGDLVEGKTYDVQDLSGQLVVGIQPILAQNCGVDAGVEVQPYIDPVRGIAVYDFTGALGGDGE